MSRSKWFNRIVVELTDPFAIDVINAFPFVEQSHVTSVAIVRSDFMQLDKTELSSQNVTGSRSVLEGQGVLDDTVNYGSNYPQVHIHEGEYLHNKGYRGQGITIAVLDGGYLNYQTNPAFDSVRAAHQILGTYDFVTNDSSVNEDNSHGANVLSMMASNRPGVMVGTAPKANYWLFRTEDVASEKPIEEYNWIEALEKADSLGADMISSSLGYYVFDDPQFDHSYAQRDGNTTQITIAADLAVKKGLIVMNAAGNTGNAPDESKYILVPGDGDSVMTVGAVNTSGTIGGFSSWGPNGAGKLKPNIVSVGAAAVYTNSIGNVVMGNGTSLANPNIAGLIACLWQAFPEFSNTDIMDAVQRSAHMYANPDNRYGYGIPNFRTASAILETKRLENDSLLTSNWIKTFPNPFKQLFTVFFKAPSTGRASLRVIDLERPRIIRAECRCYAGQPLQSSNDSDRHKTFRFVPAAIFRWYKQKDNKAYWFVNNAAKSVSAFSLYPFINSTFTVFKPNSRSMNSTLRSFSSANTEQVMYNSIPPGFKEEATFETIFCWSVL